MDYRGAENPAGSGRGSTEVVQEIRESGISQGQGRGERDSTQCRGRQRLCDGLPQKLYTEAERVAARQLGLRLLKKKAVAVVKLAIRAQAGRGDTGNRNGRQGQRQRNRAGRRDAKSAIGPLIGKAKFIRVARTEGVAVGKGDVVVAKRLLADEAGKGDEA